MLIWSLIVVTILILVYSIWRLSRKRLASLNGRVVLVTGSGSGLGRQLCLAFAHENCHIICVDIDKDGNNETVELIKEISKTIQVLSFNIDISDKNKVREIRHKILLELNSTTGVDILINNAGVIYLDPITDYTDDQIEQLINVNYLAHFWTIRTFLPDMIEKNRGTIVAILSISAKMATYNLSLYASAKSAVAGLMKSLQMELLLQNSNINTLCVFSGGMATKFCASLKLNENIPSDNVLPGVLWVYNIPIVIMDPKFVATKIIEAIKDGKSEIIIPYWNYLLLRILSSLCICFGPVIKMMKFKRKI